MSLFEYGYVGVFTYYLQLFDSRRTIYVTRYEQRIFALLSEHNSQLAAHSSLTASLKSAHKDYRRGLVGNIDFAVRAAHNSYKLFVDDFDNLLSRIESFEYIVAYGFLTYVVDKFFDNGEIYVRLKKGYTYFAHCLLDFEFGQLTFVFQLGKDMIEFFAESAESSHFSSLLFDKHVDSLF